MFFLIEMIKLAHTVIHSQKFRIEFGILLCFLFTMLCYSLSFFIYTMFILVGNIVFLFF